ncbi:hypothetical protein [Legionella hackeliae]|uniref:Phasin domain-containing protein n=1 Tax=Legionella hackeliae TaxID=449 RepID=A0A0A8UR01_LEGHA|nr:hypothetical protein [Legionella hackeliae]KTD12871.1 hypothetical protein Lhac_1742 [Legionella hackeliae]CEK09179.1 conserved protein of unknown function [Legionella hackeliae]STX49087.1 Uncharacterised protein [Legionella hackeliae]
MQQDYMSNWTNIVNRMQRPLQAIMELNTRTLQNISYLKPEDLSKIRKPEELLEKQMHVFVENGHKALDYMQKSFAIFEESLLSMSKEVKERTEETTRQAKDVMTKAKNN